MSGTLSVSNEGVELIRRWDAAVKRLNKAKAEVSAAECDVMNAANTLGKWMVPKPNVGEVAPIGEQFAICIENGFLTIKQVSERDFEVSWRKRPFGKNCIL